MSIGNTGLRILVFAIGIPLLIVSAFLLPQWGYPVFSALAIIAAGLSAHEASLFFPYSIRTYPLSNIALPVIGGVIPFVGYLERQIPNSPGGTFLVTATMMLVSGVVLAAQPLKRHAETYPGIIPTVTAHVFLMIYPGLFAWHVIRVTTLPNASYLIAIFLLATYLNDSAAWLFGRLFGRMTTRPGAPPPVAISPNKSVVGFIGGFLASPLVMVVAGLLFPHILEGTMTRRILFGVAIGVATIFGDLVESALKRSASVKDSGDLIPGRGGLLDSIDSPLFAAPVFYYGFVILFTGSV